MGLILIFLLGTGNFAVHRAVLDSRHPMFDRLPVLYTRLGGRFSLALEFAMLLGAMLMVAQGSLGWGLFYTCYSVVNVAWAWLITTGRA